MKTIKELSRKAFRQKFGTTDSCLEYLVLQKWGKVQFHNSLQRNILKIFMVFRVSFYGTFRERQRSLTGDIDEGKPIFLFFYNQFSKILVKHF